jgi:hypothetical protein
MLHTDAPPCPALPQLAPPWHSWRAPRHSPTEQTAGGMWREARRPDWSHCCIMPSFASSCTGLSCHHSTNAIFAPEQGRQFPVEVLYTAMPEESYVDAAITAALQIHCDEGEGGDVLVFLTGQVRNPHKHTCASACLFCAGSHAQGAMRKEGWVRGVGAGGPTLGLVSSAALVSERGSPHRGASASLDIPRWSHAWVVTPRSTAAVHLHTRHCQAWHLAPHSSPEGHCQWVVCGAGRD